MPRKTNTITLKQGRDAGKTFRITEWPAMKIEAWVLRGAFGLGKAGVEIPPQVMELGAAAIAYFIGTQVLKMPSRLGIRLADELMECVQRVEPKLDRSLVENDIEDFETRLQLKMEVLKIFFGFFVGAAFQMSDPPASGTRESKP